MYVYGFLLNLTMGCLGGVANCKLIRLTFITLATQTYDDEDDAAVIASRELSRPENTVISMSIIKDAYDHVM